MLKLRNSEASEMFHRHLENISGALCEILERQTTRHDSLMIGTVISIISTDQIRFIILKLIF